MTAPDWAVATREDVTPQWLGALLGTEVDSVEAQDILDRHFANDSANPVIVVTPEDDLQDTLRIVGAHDGVAAKGTSYLPEGLPGPNGPPPPKIVDGRAIVLATLSDPAESAAAVAAPSGASTSLRVTAR